MKAKRRAVDEAFAAFMNRAYEIELEATERYAQFAEQMERHNNREVAQIFRKLSEIEALHAKRILGEMRWPSVAVLPPAYAWDTAEGPETAPFDSLHYLMQPWHALEIALRCEQAALRYYESIVASRAPQRVRDAARDMAADEAEHVRLIQEWMQRVPRPAAGWDEDPDPPRTND